MRKSILKRWKKAVKFIDFTTFLNDLQNKLDTKGSRKQFIHKSLTLFLYFINNQVLYTSALSKHNKI